MWNPNMSLEEKIVAHPLFANCENPSNDSATDPLWNVLRSREAISAAEAFTAAELPAIAGLSGLLVRHLPNAVLEKDFGMTVGSFMRQIMRELNYEPDRADVQINLPGLFSTGIVYRRPDGPPMRDRSKRLDRAQRVEWANARINLN